MFLKLYLISFITFLVLDLVWLTLIAKDFYAKHIGLVKFVKHSGIEFERVW